ncbi:hypothetical protein BDW59DRAFT_30825 [Aspergillus cavernicola]|uniref:Secreted protein n=1 Tax=Aspergillus cavernicola TaxID=176166 RepID=A0ABR4HE96_9EURO
MAARSGLNALLHSFRLLRAIAVYVQHPSDRRSRATQSLVYPVCSSVGLQVLSDFRNLQHNFKISFTPQALNRLVDEAMRHIRQGSGCSDI